MEGAKVSVIVPVYKVEPYLKRCVDSVRGQTYENLEIILVDDGSPDSCGAMCDEFAAQDGRIRVIHQQNGGLSRARNAGLDIATGDYIGFVDSDDWILPEMYDTLLKLMLRYDADITCCNVIREYSDGRREIKNACVDDLLSLNREEAMGMLVSKFKLRDNVWQKLYRREIFDGMRFRKDIYYEDADIMYKLFHRAERIVYTGQPLYVNYRSENSITRSGFSVRRFDIFDVFARRVDFCKEFYPQHYEMALIHYFSEVTGYLIDARRAPEYAELRRKHCKQLMRYVFANPRAFLKCGRGTQKHLFFFAFGPSGHDFLLGVLHKAKLCLLRLIGREKRG